MAEQLDEKNEGNTAVGKKDAKKEWKPLKLRIVTPYKVVADEEADFVLVNAIDGEKGFLADHEPCSLVLDIGLVKAFRQKEEIISLAALGGFATVRDNQVIVMTPIAEPPEKVEEVIAQIEQERSENKVHELFADAEMSRAEIALRRSLVKNDVSAFAIIKGKLGQTDNSNSK